MKKKSTQSLFDQTLEMLRKTDKSAAEIAAETGLGRHWLEKMRQGRFSGDGVRRVERLAEYLMNSKNRANN